MQVYQRALNCNPSILQVLIGWSDRTIVISFRGTASFRNAIADLQVNLLLSVTNVVEHQLLHRSPGLLACWLFKTSRVPIPDRGVSSDAPHCPLQGSIQG